MRAQRLGWDEGTSGERVLGPRGMRAQRLGWDEGTSVGEMGDKRYEGTSGGEWGPEMG